MTDTNLVPVPEAPAPDTQELTVSEKLNALVESHRDTFLPDAPRKQAPAPAATPVTITESDRANIRAHHEVAMRDFATACDAEAADIRREVAFFQRELAGCAAMLSIDPVEGQRIKAELMKVQAGLMEREARLARTREHLTQVLYQLTEQYIWGTGPDAEAAEARELPLLLAWGRAQGMSDAEILLAGQSPAVAHGLYKAWKAGNGAPIPKTPPKGVKNVPAPSGRTPPPVRVVSKRRTGGADRDLDSVAGEALIRGLRRGR